MMACFQNEKNDLADFTIEIFLVRLRCFTKDILTLFFLQGGNFCIFYILGKSSCKMPKSKHEMFA